MLLPLSREGGCQKSITDVLVTGPRTGGSGTDGGAERVEIKSVGREYGEKERWFL
jgi:hypothetical protein